MGIIANPNERFWRTDTGKLGREIYALLSNDVSKPSENDPLVGVMESSDLAETTVDMHNALLEVFGRNYQQRVNDLHE